MSNLPTRLVPVLVLSLLELVESCFDFKDACSDDVGGGQHLKVRTGK